MNDVVTHNVVRRFGVETLIKSYQKDEHFNTKITPIEAWDLLGGFAFSKKTGEMTLRPTTTEPIDNRLLKEAGEGYSSATAVCIYKEAARQVVENALQLARNTLKI